MRFAPRRSRLRSRRTGSSAWRLRTSANANAASRTPPARQRSQDLGVAPVGCPVGAGGRVGQAVDQRDHPAGSEDDAGKVEPARPAPGARQHGQGAERGTDADRHVDEQHPPPGGVCDKQASGEQPSGASGHAHRGVYAHGTVAGRTLGEHGGDQRQRGRRDDRAAGALDGPGRQQPRLGSGQPAGEGCGREQQQADNEHLAPAKQVTGTAAEQQQAAERQRIAVDHPLQAAVGKSEGRLDVGQRDVDDGGVEDDHQLRGRDDQQGQAEVTAAVPGAGRVRCGKCRCHGNDAGGRTAGCRRPQEPTSGWSAGMPRDARVLRGE